jgi:hypothetical protein
MVNTWENGGVRDAAAGRHAEGRHAAARARRQRSCRPVKNTRRGQTTILAAYLRELTAIQRASASILPTSRKSGDSARS